MSKAELVMQYCNMTTRTPHSMEYFMRKKHSCRMSKPIIKKEIYERHYIKGVSYINPNIEKLLKRNHQNAEKIRKFVERNVCAVR